MKTIIQMIAVFFAPIALLAWMCVLTKMAVHFYGVPGGLAAVVAIAVATVQILVVIALFEIGVIGDEKPRGME